MIKKVTMRRKSQLVTISTHNGVDGDIYRRIGMARTVFQMLKKVWSSSDITNTMKLKV